MHVHFVSRVRQDLKDRILAATKFYAKILLDSRIVRDLHIDYVLSARYSLWGECFCDDEFERKPRFFTIKLKRADEDDMMSTIAHEMVHVKQFVKGEYRSGVPSKFGSKAVGMWNGQAWYPKRHEDPYYDAPWEIDAFGREVGLYDRYVKQGIC